MRDDKNRIAVGRAMQSDLNKRRSEVGAEELKPCQDRMRFTEGKTGMNTFAGNFCAICGFDLNSGFYHSCGGSPTFCTGCGRVAHQGKCDGAFVPSAVTGVPSPSNSVSIRFASDGLQSTQPSLPVEAAGPKICGLCHGKGKRLIAWPIGTRAMLRICGDCDGSGKLNADNTAWVPAPPADTALTEDRDILALQNCRLLAQREIRRHEGGDARKPTGITTLAAWKHILRFCEEAGVIGSILRGDADTSAAEG